MRGAAKAAVLGAAISSFLYLMVTAGLEAGFRARQAVADRRARRDNQERNSL